MNKEDVNHDSWRDHASEYERGFIDGMQRQAQSSVDKAINRMAQPEQGPVAPALPIGTKLYTSPPQRTWVGLTDEEMLDAIYCDDTPMERGRRVEAKLKEKNT